MNDSLDPILQQEEQRKLRVQLMWRLVIAALLVGGVLGTLAWLEQEKGQTPQMTMTSPRDIRIASHASSVMASLPAIASEPMVPTPVVAASEPQIASSPASAPALAPHPASTPQTASEQSPVSTPAPQAPPVKPLAPPIAQTPITPVAKPAVPAVAQPVTPTKPAEPTRPQAPVKAPPPQKTVDTPRSAPQHPQPSALPSPDKLARQAAAPATHYPAPIATPNGYTVQAGVFLHSANAEKMLSTVQTAGIPAYLETRVQIGPFNTRTEAEAAVKKLRQLGVEPVINKGN